MEREDEETAEREREREYVCEKGRGCMVDKERRVQIGGGGG